MKIIIRLLLVMISMLLIMCGSFGTDSGDSGGKINPPGNGALLITATWSSSLIVTPVINASLTPTTGTPTTIIFTIDASNGVASYSNSSITAGNYTLNVQLLDDTTYMTSFTDNITIAASQTTSSNILFNLSSGSQIIADHTVIERFNYIPDQYITAVKKMWFNIPGESHSAAYRQGLVLLAAQNSKYAAVSTESGSNPEAYTDQHLRVSGHLWALYEAWGYGAGEFNWYTWYAYSEASRPNEQYLIKRHITHCNTNNLTISAIGFAWCWDMTSIQQQGGVDPVYLCHWYGKSDKGPDGDTIWGLDADDTSLTNNRVSMNTYLNATEEYRLYCKNNGYSTKVVFTTGPVDGATGVEYQYQREVKHEYIRKFVKANPERILFDYADILCYDDGNPIPATSTWTDSLGTVHTFPGITTTNFGDGSIGHIGSAGAIRLAKAQWWMLARIAGWDGK